MYAAWIAGMTVHPGDRLSLSFFNHVIINVLWTLAQTLKSSRSSSAYHLAFCKVCFYSGALACHLSCHICLQVTQVELFPGFELLKVFSRRFYYHCTNLICMLIYVAQICHNHSYFIKITSYNGIQQSHKSCIPVLKSPLNEVCEQSPIWSSDLGIKYSFSYFQFHQQCLCLWYCFIFLDICGDLWWRY